MRAAAVILVAVLLWRTALWFRCAWQGAAFSPPPTRHQPPPVFPPEIQVAEPIVPAESHDAWSAQPEDIAPEEASRPEPEIGTNDGFIWNETPTQPALPLSGATESVPAPIAAATHLISPQDAVTGVTWLPPDLALVESAVATDAVDGMRIRGNEASVRCPCGLAYRWASVVWLQTFLEGRCPGCGALQAQSPAL